MKRRNFLASLAALVTAPKALQAEKPKPKFNLRYRPYNPPVIGQKKTPDVFGGMWRWEIENPDGTWKYISQAEAQKLLNG